MSRDSCRKLIQRLGVPSIWLIAIAYAIVYGWEIIEYLTETSDWECVDNAIDRRGVRSESSVTLALASAFITVIASLATAANVTLIVRVNRFLLVPIVSYFTAMVCYGRYEGVLFIHLCHALSLIGILSWPGLLRLLADLFDRTPSSATTAQSSFRFRMVCVTMMLIVFIWISTDVYAVWQVIIDRTQTGATATATAPAFSSKLNLWSIALGYAHAMVGMLCVWTCKTIDRWTIIRMLVVFAATVLAPPLLVDAFEQKKLFWPVMHSYGPGVAAYMRRGYVTWFILTALFTMACLFGVRQWKSRFRNESTDNHSSTQPTASSDTSNLS